MRKEEAAWGREGAPAGGLQLWSWWARFHVPATGALWMGSQAPPDPRGQCHHYLRTLAPIRSAFTCCLPAVGQGLVLGGAALLPPLNLDKVSAGCFQNLFCLSVDLFVPCAACSLSYHMKVSRSWPSPLVLDGTFKCMVNESWG